MTDQRKPIEWTLHYHNEGYRGFIRVSLKFEEEIPFPIPLGVTNLDVIEKSAYDKAVSALKESDCYCQKDSLNTKEFICIRCKTLCELGDL